MTPYFEDDAVTLYLGDCLDVLPRLGPVDHVITDPPYEEEAHTKARRSPRGSKDSSSWRQAETLCEAHEIDFAAIGEGQREAWSRLLVEASSGWVLAFCQVEAVGEWRRTFVDAGAKWIRGQVWIKPDGTPQFTGDRPAQGFESIATVWAGEGRCRWNGGGRRGVYTHLVNGGGAFRQRAAHPTAKPVPLMRELVRLFSDPGDVILDPFAGSGTTGLAARLEGRRAILVEQEERYAEVAARRLERLPTTRDGDAQVCLFDDIRSGA